MLLVSFTRLLRSVSVLTSTSSLAYSNSCSCSVDRPVWVDSVSRSSAVLLMSIVDFAKAPTTPPITVTAAAPLAENFSRPLTALCTPGGSVMPKALASPLTTSARLTVDLLTCSCSSRMLASKFSCLATSVCALTRLDFHCMVVWLASPSRRALFS